MSDPIGRYLGFAFAGADLLVEIDPVGQIAFALGAAQRLVGWSDSMLVGLDWTQLIAPEDHGLAQALIQDLGAAQRRGPVRVTLRAQGKSGLQHHAALSVCRLPQAAPNISVVLGFLTPGMSASGPATDGDGRQSAAAFATFAGAMIDEARASGRVANVELVELSGLARGAALVGPEASREIIAGVSAMLKSRSLGGQAAGMIAADRFAFISDGGEDLADLTGRISRFAADAGITVKPETARLESGDLAGPAGVQALQHALERYATSGAAAASEDFAKTLARTLSDGEQFKAIVARGDYRLEFQPVVRMASGGLHHFEALARFNNGENLDDIFRLAEDLDLIQAFDLSVVERVASALRKAEPATRIAANISARSLGSAAFIDGLLARAKGPAGFASRLLIEVTETSAIDDLAAANQHIQRLRHAGHTVCLDDFGAGSASLDYLRCLDVDIVKIDGRFVRSLAAGGRDEKLLTHMVAMCRELQIRTVAEMVETPDTARIVRQLGIDMGQGWYFCRPLAEPRWAPETPNLRRSGERESWG